MKKLMIVMMVLNFGLAQAEPEVFSVGTDGQCDFNNIQDAIDAGNGDYVTVTNQKIFREHLVIDSKTVGIYGGFADCTAAENVVISNNKTTISGDLDDDGTGDGIVISILGTGHVEIWGLKITEGRTASQGGGIFINKTADKVFLKNSVVTDNWANYGGGVAVIDSPDVEVAFGEGFFIIDNSANLAGGGFYCNDTSVISMKDTVQNAGVSVNSSGFSGGGVYLNNGCQMTFKAGRINPGFLDFRGIAGNSANLHGGGVMVANGAKLYLTPPAGQTVNISDNVADNDDNGTGFGGGIYVTGTGSLVEANNSYLAINTAVKGGGAYVKNAGILNWTSSAQGCVDKNRCAYIKDNKADQNGGAFYATDTDSEINLVRAALEFNRADFGTAIYADANAEVEAEFSLFSRNGMNGGGEYLDIGVIQAHNDAWLNFKNITIADNMAETAVFVTGMTPFSINLYNSIVHDPSSGLVADVSQQQASDFLAFCVMFHEDANGLYGNNLVVQDPIFTDRNARDFSIDGTQSGAVDECFQLSQLTKDYLGNTTPWDDPNVTVSGDGTDMGAFESYDGDVIFKHGLED